jgi:hypothetical protein
MTKTKQEPVYVYACHTWNGVQTSMIVHLTTDLESTARRAQEASKPTPGTRAYVTRWTVNVEGSRRCLLEYQGGRLRFDFREKVAAEDSGTLIKM